ncbi:MAG: response regulator [Desulfobacterales bacterium]|nr:response regulator [Desulfobacterales bacterium]
MTIGRKLFIGFLVVSIQVGLLGYIAVNSSIQVGELFEYTEAIKIPSLLETVELKAAARMASIKAIEYSLRGEQSDKLKTIEALQKLDTHLDLLNKAETIERGKKEEQSCATIIKEINDRIVHFKKEIISYIEFGPKGLSQEELFSKEKNIHKARKSLILTLYQHGDLEHKDLHQALAKTRNNIKNGTRIILILSVANVFLAILIGFFITRSISKPIQKLRNASDEIGKGKLYTKVDIRTNNEIGQLANSFNKMAEDLNIYQHHLEELVEKRTTELQTANQQLQKEIVERKQAEEEVINERERLEVTLRSIGDGVIATDPEGKIVLINKVAEELTGWKNEEALGKPLEDVFQIINEITRKVCEHPVKKVIESGKVAGLANHTVLIARDGTERILADSAAPIHSKDSKIIGVVLVFRDITEERKIETQLLQAQKMEAIGTLSGGIAHDFNNLLMGILGHASLMLLHTAPDHPHFERLKSIEDIVQTGANLSKQLLGFARGGKYEAIPTDLNELIKQSSEMFGLTQKNIEVNIKYQKDIWPVNVDQGQINQAMLNIYVNAWHAMPDGGHIYISTSNVKLDESYIKPFNVKPGNYVKISLTDTGTGMDKATQKRIFEPFFTTRKTGQGTGLGLASTYGIIKNHEGFINVYSEKGKGTTFNIYFPASDQKVSITKKTAAGEFSKDTGTVLIVDDENRVLEIGRDMLREMGYNVLSAESGEEAIKIYMEHKNNIDLVIVDIIMPQMDGGKVFDRMKEINPNVRVLISSGYSINGKASEILERGCNGFIQKPFNLSDLSQKIREIIGKK